MTALFTSWACDYCDGLRPPTEGYHRGYVVLREEGLEPESYVFPSREDAARWRAAQGLEGCPIRAVLSELPFRWRDGGGSVRRLRLADRLYEIYPDHHFEPGPQRAFLCDEAEPD